MTANPTLPNFFIVGAPKAGTTALYNYLDQHRQIYMSPLKETNYFASEFRIDNFAAASRPQIAREMQSLQEYLNSDMREKRFGGLVSNWDDYLKLFKNASNELAIGEATPCYLWSKSAARNIAARIPHAKIIINLRNPVDRAFSQYLHMLTVGSTRRSFRDQIDANLNCKSELLGPLRPLLEFGHYCEQIERYFNEFPKSQIHISFYEDLASDPAVLLSKLFAFLGVDADFPADVSGRHTEPRVPRLLAGTYYLKRWRIWPHLARFAAPLNPRIRSWMLRSRAQLAMRPTDRAFLTDYYRKEIDSLARLLDRDLSAWLRTNT